MHSFFVDNEMRCWRLWWCRCVFCCCCRKCWWPTEWCATSVTSTLCAASFATTTAVDSSPTNSTADAHRKVVHFVVWYNKNHRVQPDPSTQTIWLIHKSLANFFHDIFIIIFTTKQYKAQRYAPCPSTTCAQRSGSLSIPSFQKVAGWEAKKSIIIKMSWKKIGQRLMNQPNNVFILI